MYRLSAFTAYCALFLALASCGHKAEPKYCSQQFGADTQALLSAGQEAEAHWNEIKGDLKKINLERLKPYKKQCDTFFGKYDASSTCVSALDGAVINPLALKEGCDNVQKAFKTSNP